MDSVAPPAAWLDPVTKHRVAAHRISHVDRKLLSTALQSFKQLYLLVQHRQYASLRSCDRGTAGDEHRRSQCQVTDRTLGARCGLTADKGMMSLLGGGATGQAASA